MKLNDINTEKLRYYRIANGLSIKKLAKLLDCDKRTISAWERGLRTPRTANLVRLAEIYNIPYEELKREIGSMPENEIDTTKCDPNLEKRIFCFNSCKFYLKFCIVATIASYLCFQGFFWLSFLFSNRLDSPEATNLFFREIERNLPIFILNGILEAVTFAVYAATFVFFIVTLRNYDGFIKRLRISASLPFLILQTITWIIIIYVRNSHTDLSPVLSIGWTNLTSLSFLITAISTGITYVTQRRKK